MSIGPSQPAGEPRVELDFYQLRSEGIAQIQATGSDRWTDFNTHDPGITILESLAYAVTDLAYRSGFPIEDLLAAGASSASADDPYPDQAFFPARRILTVNPTTPTDLRRLLVDLDQVRNAWVRCRECPCEAPMVGAPLGLYDVALELEPDPELGDLNDRKVVRRRSVEVDGRLRPLTVEVRFPAWPLARREERRGMTAGQPLAQLTIAGPNNTTSGVTPVTDDELRRHWFDVLYVDFELGLADGTTIALENASVRLYGDAAVRRQATVASLLGWLADATAEGFVEPYRRKLARTDAAVSSARAVLESHRNLDEDFCHVGVVEIDDIAVCAQVEVDPTADLEQVQALIWLEIERYLDPPVEFWSLDDLLARGIAVEDIFDGPELGSGFLTDDGLAATDMRTELRGSDLIDRLSDIPGVVSVANLLMTGYDASGNPLQGRADPTWHDGAPEFDPQRTSAAWLLYPQPGHRTRLHRGLSAFQFTSRGLPFLPREDEAEASLVQLRGRTTRPKLRGTDLDLPVPLGNRRDLDSYHPIQNGFPLAYGVGPDGLPSTATPARRAQARQLKGYLMVYEQLLRNAHAQLAHAGDLFSLDPAVDRTYFAATLQDCGVAGYDELVDASLDEAALARLVETRPEFLERRNRFLDHLLARFGESFADYAMALTDLEGQARAREDLIDDKIAYLRVLPRLGHDRGRAFDRAHSPCDPENASGLEQRVNLLLGLPHRPAWDAHERAIVVEHLLLRAKFPGDATIPTCSDQPGSPDGPGCQGGSGPAGCSGCCADADPYSFRLTYVMPGWREPFSTNLAMRAYADRTIQEQAPAHLLVKTCWVGKDQFEEFAAAWCAWAQADAAMDWTAEHLLETVLELLARGAPAVDRAALCGCAAEVLETVGTAFREWLDARIEAGTPLADFPEFAAPVPTACAGIALEPGVAEQVGGLLAARYATYVEVSYRLHILVDLLGGLRNTYPQATLHDCDEGSDSNPVRLGQTALGSS